ncbi:hypothetical protein D9M71_832830 [compost metagenome]
MLLPGLGLAFLDASLQGDIHGFEALYLEQQITATALSSAQGIAFLYKLLVFLEQCLLVILQRPQAPKHLFTWPVIQGL